MKTKDFDCVRMKHDIQQKLLAEFRGLSLEERRRLIERRIASDPVLGPFWRNVRRVQTQGRGAHEP